MTRAARFAALVVPLLVSTLACSALAGPEILADTPAPGVESPPPSAVPQDTSLLFQDDFSDTSSGWDRAHDSDGLTDYEDGIYRIFVDTSNLVWWSVPGRSFDDVRIQVDATKIGGPDDNAFGLICRYQDSDNFYAFLISSDAFYAIVKYSAGDSEILGADAMLESSDIHQGEATNRVRADCVGSKLSLYANGESLVSVTDSDFDSGDVGLIARTFDEPGADIAFDDFVVRKP